MKTKHLIIEVPDDWARNRCGKCVFQARCMSLKARGECPLANAREAVKIKETL